MVLIPRPKRLVNILPSSRLSLLMSIFSYKHGLPPLLNKAAVTALENPESRAYYRGYHGADGNVPAVPRRKELILDAIGCK
jgi:hypothetical protein